LKNGSTKLQITNHKSQITNHESQITNHKLQVTSHKLQNTSEGRVVRQVFDLEERTFEFSKAVRLFVGSLPKTVANVEDVKQLIRSSGSVGANYREANQALGKKDFLFKVRISRKEAKECVYWLRTIQETNSLANPEEARKLMTEAGELTNILSAILAKANGSTK
jgi:four helix bundle protein